jgi:hypothetical protein
MVTAVSAGDDHGVFRGRPSVRSLDALWGDAKGCRRIARTTAPSRWRRPTDMDQSPASGRSYHRPAGEPAGPLLSMRCHPKYPPCRLIGSGLGRRWWSRGAAQREPFRWGLTSLYGCCHWSLVSRNTGSEAPSMATSGRSWRARSGYRGKDRHWSSLRRCSRADHADRPRSDDHSIHHICIDFALDCA